MLEGVVIVPALAVVFFSSIQLMTIAWRASQVQFEVSKAARTLAVPDSSNHYPCSSVQSQLVNFSSYLGIQRSSGSRTPDGSANQRDNGGGTTGGSNGGGTSSGGSTSTSCSYNNSGNPKIEFNQINSGSSSATGSCSFCNSSSGGSGRALVVVKADYTAPLFVSAFTFTYRGAAVAVLEKPKGD